MWHVEHQCGIAIIEDKWHPTLDNTTHRRFEVNDILLSQDATSHLSAFDRTQHRRTRSKIKWHVVMNGSVGWIGHSLCSSRTLRPSVCNILISNSCGCSSTLRKQRAC